MKSLQVRRLFSALLIGTICLFCYTGCGKSEAVVAVEEQIDAIGDVTPESVDLIAAADEAFAALSDEEQRSVGNLDTLSAAHVALAEALIDNIGEVTSESEGAIANAEAAYNNLSDEQKSQVANYELLSAAREAFDSLSVMKTDYMGLRVR